MPIKMNETLRDNSRDGSISKMNGKMNTRTQWSIIILVAIVLFKFFGVGRFIKRK